MAVRECQASATAAVWYAAENMAKKESAEGGRNRIYDLFLQSHYSAHPPFPCAEETIKASALWIADTPGVRARASIRPTNPHISKRNPVYLIESRAANAREGWLCTAQIVGIKGRRIPILFRFHSLRLCSCEEQLNLLQIERNRNMCIAGFNLVVQSYIIIYIMSSSMLNFKSIW